jgi:LacI family transcriptional regulator
MHKRVEGKWLGGYRAEQELWPEVEKLPALLADEEDEQRFTTWRKQFKPDAILLAETHVERWIEAIGLRGRRAPVVAWLRRIESMPKNTFAIDTRPDKMGAAAVELVVAQIHRNERGSPETPHTLLLDGVWSE